jgi:drug/metabolite transporter (DMT)-like permease
MVKLAVERVGVFGFNGVRFVIAAIALGAVAGPRMRTLGRNGWRHGLLLGMALFAGYALQTAGLQLTRASNAGFVTGMFVVFTPLLGAVVLRRAPGWASVAGALLAFVGLSMLSLDEGFTPRTGDVLVLGCAVAFAVHIVGLGAWSARHDPVALTVVQLVVVGVAHTAVIPFVAAPARWDGYVVIAILVTALIASAAAFWVQTAAQRVIPPTRTAVILTMEPVFAGLFGFVLLDERLAPRGWAGCALILVGMLVAELVGSAPPPVPPEDLTATVGASSHRA